MKLVCDIIILKTFDILMCAIKDFNILEYVSELFVKMIFSIDKFNQLC